MTNGDGSTLCARLYVRIRAYASRHNGEAPTVVLLSTRVARQVIAELRPLLEGEDDGRVINPQELTALFGVPVKVVTDLPQGAVLR